MFEGPSSPADYHMRSNSNGYLPEESMPNETEGLEKGEMPRQDIFSKQINLNWNRGSS